RRGQRGLHRLEDHLARHALLVGNCVDHQQKLFAHCNNSMGAARRPIGNLAFAFVLERRDQETTIPGCASTMLLRSSVNAKIRKQPSMAALFSIRPSMTWLCTATIHDRMVERDDSGFLLAG